MSGARVRAAVLDLGGVLTESPMAAFAEAAAALAEPAELTGPALDGAAA